jgi:uncharacterized protein YbcC (UPF0753/DUF2309 family)
MVVFAAAKPRAAKSPEVLRAMIQQLVEEVVPAVEGNGVQASPEQGKALLHAIEHAAHLLPSQGPINIFIHHNTLHAFEGLSFLDGVKKGARTFNCQPFLTEAQYREALGRGRIRFDDLRAVLGEELGAPGKQRIAGLCSLFDLRLAMLQYPLRFGPREELAWFVAETDALKRVRSDVSAADRARLIAETRRWVMRDLRGGNESTRNGKSGSLNGRTASPMVGLLDRFGTSSIEAWGEDRWEAFTLQALWRACCEGVAPLPPPSAPAHRPTRHRDVLLAATGADSDLPVNALLIRFCAAFLDQGFASWPMPDREKGLYRAFITLFRQAGGAPDPWMAGLAAELNRLADQQIAPLTVIRQSLDDLGVPESKWDVFLSLTLLALPGWAGMIQNIEERGDRVHHGIPRGSLVDFLAVRLLLDRFSLRYTAVEELGYTGPLAGLPQAAQQRAGAYEPPSVEQRAFAVFQLAQVLGWAPPVLCHLDRRQWAALVEEIEGFSPLERRRTYHLAYERRFVIRSLDSIALHAPVRQEGRPRFQASFCLDEREESLRRHLEEIAPDVETFGIAGFYGLAMYYRGAADAHFVPLCPIVVRPKHWVTEQVVDTHEELHERRARARRALGLASHHFNAGSRSFALGAVLSAGLGVMASIPLVGRILFPRLTAKLMKLCGRFVQPPPATRLLLERSGSEPSSPEQPGYTVEEMAAIAERQLRDLGLTKNFSRLVILNGHGSVSLNNPHESAHDCGACGGSPGSANGRALARMLNDPRIRTELAGRGLVIPNETVFVGGIHNTCNDSLRLWDLDQVPPTHRADLEAARRDLEAACDRDAHERCRRFESAPLTLSFTAARQHVEGRSSDLAQTRPEWGHATNALCIVGRRERTRGLFLDRRAFLTSYDPTQDDDQATILTRLLQAAVPVCAGISLEYYFSRVDPTGWGSGTKLPHNITSLLGVMDGAASDLRTGLPWQMVEIHEPVRLLFVIETTPETMLRIMDRNPGIAQVIRGGWSLLAVLDPDSSAIQMYRDGAFHPYEPEAKELPRAGSSVDWYRGWRDHLEFAEIS